MTRSALPPEMDMEPPKLTVALDATAPLPTETMPPFSIWASFSVVVPPETISQAGPTVAPSIVAPNEATTWARS